MTMLLTSLLLFGLTSGASFDKSGPVFHWKLDEGQVTVARDSSGHGFDGVIGAAWVTSSVGNVLRLDGTPGSTVSVELPLKSRLGHGSWSVSAWVKPKQFAIDSRQNQRRLFAYGLYPESEFNVDLLSDGRPSFYQCYRHGGRDQAFYAEAPPALALDRWAFLAVVSDRNSGSMEIFINGVLRSKGPLPKDVDPDLNVSGLFTTGSGWQNYMGDVAEVQLFSRAESPAEIKAEFAQIKGRFGVVPTQQELISDAIQSAQDDLDGADKAWAAHGDTASARSLAKVVANAGAPPAYRSYAELRLAQGDLRTGDRSKARATYARIAANPTYPAIHREEAAEQIRDLDRTGKGLPPRDPNASKIVPSHLPSVRQRFFVSPAGNDANPGTKQRPIATLAAARDRVRAAVSAHKKGTIEVELAPGEYKLVQSVTFTARDTGTAESPVVYRAEKPGTTTFYGGARLTGFNPVTDPAILGRLPTESRGKVVQLDLRARGITDFGKLAVRGFGQAPSPPTLELYIDGKPQTLARWPNTGFVTPAKLVEPGNNSTDSPSVLAYQGDRPARWLHAEDPWLFGYFQYLWADGTVQVAKIDPDAKTFTTAHPYHYGAPGMTDEQGIKFYAFNLLEEIDIPGEWYLDRNTGILYLYPPANFAHSTVEISMLTTPMVTAEHLNHVRFEGLKFDLGRSDGLDLTDCRDCQMVGCTVKRMALNGVCVHGGSRDSLISCDISDTGRRATEIIGGDRAALTPGGHVVANCLIHDFGRIDRTYTPGIQLEGVGNHVVHNVFYNCPSSAMRIEGNDHVIEYNEVHHVLLESDDQGSMELFGNPTYRGVVFRYNYYHDLGTGAQEKLVAGQAGIRLDDAISGVLIYGNVFVRAANGVFGGVQINSGRDNVIDNNVFVDSARAISGGYYAGNGVWAQLAGAARPPDFIVNDLYRRRYPEMKLLLTEPAVNHVWRNVFYRIGQDLSRSQSSFDVIGNGFFPSLNPGFVDPGHRDFRLNPKRPFALPGFQPIPFSEIGLYRDPWRSHLK